MGTTRETRIAAILSPVLVGSALVFAYANTLAPGLTWANNGADGGDFITAAYTGGVAHPTGYPLYLMLARFFQLLPFSNVAFRTNLLSLVFTVGAALLLYWFVLRIFKEDPNKEIVGGVTALAFGLAKLVWSQAVITEVYAMQEFLVILFLLILFGEFQLFEGHPIGHNLGLGLVVGLAFSNHKTALFLLPILLLIGLRKQHNEENPRRFTRHLDLRRLPVDWRNLGFRLVGFTLGSSLYLLLFLRARSGSPVNWGNVHDMRTFLWLVSGDLYGKYFLGLSRGMLWMRLKIWLRMLGEQNGIAALVVAFAGLSVGFNRKTRIAYASVWIFLVFFFSSIVYNSIDSYVYLVFADISLALWFGWGVASMVGWLTKKNKILAYAAFLISAAYLIFTGLQTLPKVDASHDLRADEFCSRVAETAPQGSIVFTDSDRDSFSLWYCQIVEGQRQDIRIVVDDLSTFDWYRAMLRNTYNDINVPDHKGESWWRTIVQANPDRTVCSTLVVDTGDIRCDN
jgi:hypothetical protein